MLVQVIFQKCLSYNKESKSNLSPVSSVPEDFFFFVLIQAAVIRNQDVVFILPGFHTAFVLINWSGEETTDQGGYDEIRHSEWKS